VRARFGRRTYVLPLQLQQSLFRRFGAGKMKRADF
jgi:hypothetical protein